MLRQDDQSADFVLKIKNKLSSLLETDVINKHITDHSSAKVKLIRFLNPYENAINQIGYVLPTSSIDKIQEILTTLRHEVANFPVDDLQAALDYVAERIQCARNNIAEFRTEENKLYDLDLYLQTLQLNITNYTYYLQRGIDLFQTVSRADENDEEYKTEYIDNEIKLKHILDNITEVTRVTVSAPAPNPYGHVLLCLGDAGYIHVNDLHDYPQYIPLDKFDAYLRKNNRLVAGMQHFDVPDIEAFKVWLTQVHNNKWTFLMWRNNCVDFANEGLMAGGVSCAEINPALIGGYYGNTQYPFKNVLTANPITLQHDLYETFQNIDALYFYPDIDPEDKESLENELSDMTDPNAVILLGDEETKTACFVIDKKLYKQPHSDQVAKVKVKLADHVLADQTGKIEKDEENSNDINQVIKKATSLQSSKLTHASAKKHFRDTAKNAYGYDTAKAKQYAKYRVKQGLTDEEARYKTDPGIMTFLVSHKSTAILLSSFNPLLMIATSTMLLIDSIQTKFRLSFGRFFQQKNQNTVERPLSREEKVIASTLMV